MQLETLQRIILKKSFQVTVIVVSLIALSLIFQKTSTKYILIASTQILAPVASADSIQEKVITTTLSDSITKLKTLKNQFYICQKLKDYNKFLAVTYYANYYAFSICSIIFTTLLTIAVFLVANKGWQNTPLVLKAFLLTAIILSSIYYFLPNVLNNKENFRKNTDKVKAFQKIQSDILAFSTIVNEVDESKLDIVLVSNYNQITSNFDFITTIDASKINSNPQDIIKGIKP